MIRAVLLVVGALLVAACVGRDRVVFVTKTSLSVLDADAAPPGVSIGYDRVEGYFGPSYQSGEVPPVVSCMKSDGRIFKPQIQQIYATGDAAETVLDNGYKAPNRKMSGRRNFMFFGTTTSGGLKVGFTNNLPSSFTFGYNRKEMSLIPIGSASQRSRSDGGSGNDNVNADQYPAVFAAIDMQGGSAIENDRQSARLTTSQYFATGSAAIELAGQLREVFDTCGEEALAGYRAAMTQQQSAASQILACYPGVRVTDRPAVWQEAAKYRLLHDNDDSEDQKAINLLAQAYSEAVDSTGAVLDADKLARADRLYASLVAVPDGLAPGRLQLLELHAETVCGLSSGNQAPADG